MLRNLRIKCKVLLLSKKTLLTVLLILFSIGSYTYSEGTKHPNNAKTVRSETKTLLTILKFDIPIHYSSKLVNPLGKKIIKSSEKLEIYKPKLTVSEKVMDEGIIDASTLAAFLINNNKSVDISYANKLAEIYIGEAKHEGVNPELAFAQMCLETGFLRFNGTVDRKQNNFCGLGVTGNGVVGLSFNTVEEGVRAHIQHLKAYGSTKKLKNELIDSRFKLVKRGSGSYLSDLTGKWATDKKYDKKIRNLLLRLHSLSSDSNESNS